MNLFERVRRLRILRDKASKYSLLEENEQFTQWREEVVEKRLIAYLQRAIRADLESEAGCNDALAALRNYQQLKYVTKEVFDVWRFAEVEAAKKLNKLEKKEDESLD